MDPRIRQDDRVSTWRVPLVALAQAMTHLNGEGGWLLAIATMTECVRGVQLTSSCPPAHSDIHESVASLTLHAAAARPHATQLALIHPCC